MTILTLTNGTTATTLAISPQRGTSPRSWLRWRQPTLRRTSSVVLRMNGTGQVQPCSTRSSCRIRDEDNDGVSDILDTSSDTPNEAEVGTEGCAWSQMDWDGDALLNGRTLPIVDWKFCQSHNGFIKSGTFEFGLEYYEEDLKISPDGMACLPTT